LSDFARELEIENTCLHNLVTNLKIMLRDIRCYSSDTDFAAEEALRGLLKIESFYLAQ